MGGNAFENTKRLNEKEYKSVCAKISEILTYLNISFGFPVEIADKAELAAGFGFDEPYGDVDVVVGLDDGDQEEVVKHVLGQLGGKEQRIVKHGTTFSFLTSERHQVDIKFCPKENLLFTLAFKSNNDFGGLVGHLLSSLAMKWNDMGLLLKVKVFNIPEVGTVKTEIVLTRDPDQVSDFLGIPNFSLDGQTRMSSRQIFDILTQSKIFEKELYQNEAFKKRHKVESRPLSKDFLKLLENYKDPKQEKENNFFQDFRETKLLPNEYYSKICQHFKKVDQLTEFYAKCEKQKDKVENYKCKFSFEILLQTFPDMESEMAGSVLRRLKSEKTGDYAEWVAKTDIKEILQDVERIREEIGRS